MATAHSAKRQRPEATRREAVLEHARAAGLLGQKKGARLAGRVPSKLLAAAKKRAGTKSDTEVLELALATLALEDDFGLKLLQLKGSVPRDIELEL